MVMLLACLLVGAVVARMAMMMIAVRLWLGKSMWRHVLVLHLLLSWHKSVRAMDSAPCNRLLVLPVEFLVRTLCMLSHHFKVEVAAVSVRSDLGLHHLIGLVATALLSMNWAGLDLVVLLLLFSLLLHLIVIAPVKVILHLRNMLTSWS